MDIPFSILLPESVAPLCRSVRKSRGPHAAGP